MKNLLKFPFYALLAGLFTCGFTSCSDDDVTDDDDVKNEALSAIVNQYVNHTVVPTYRNLADATIDLYDALVQLKTNQAQGSASQEDVVAVANAWIDSRTYWELSEAFLYGPADHFGIDPHIDTWPLDEAQLIPLLANQTAINRMNQAGGDIWAAENLEDAQLGFHGIEFIIFENGAVKDVSKITPNELIYCMAVAGDLRNQCFRLEAAWAGIDNVSSAKKEKLQALLKYNPTTFKISEGSSLSYGQEMMQAGASGTTYYISITDAAATIIEGCATISEEVGNTKMGKPNRGEDIHYIESPYSYNSTKDFADNIYSIENAYLGGADAAERGASISDYIKSINPTADANVKNAIQNAITKIKAIEDFEHKFAGAQTATAIEACTALTTALEEAQKVVERQ